MKCKALEDNLTVTSIATMNGQDFNQSNCILDLNMQNNSFQYILQIPIDNYLIYFTNWTINDYNLSCVNSTALMTSNMLCRYEVINCQNNGQCRPSRLNFTCECTTKDYSGRYCEIKSSLLTIKQTVKRSFGYIAIIAIVAVGGILFLMDVLKYIFNIDPVDKERKRLAVKMFEKTSSCHNTFYLCR